MGRPNVFCIEIADFLGRTEVKVADILKETKKIKGPIVKVLQLHEVDTGQVVIKFDLQLFDLSWDPSSWSPDIRHWMTGFHIVISILHDSCYDEHSLEALLLLIIAASTIL